MRLNEISDADKLFLGLKGIRYDFNDSYKIATEISAIVGKSKHRRRMGKNTIDGFLHDIRLFLRQGFSDNDPDVILAKDTFDKLENIKNSL